MPYGPGTMDVVLERKYDVSIPHMGCMPYGLIDNYSVESPAGCFNPSYGLHALRASNGIKRHHSTPGFNPSYGLHALRARLGCKDASGRRRVSIPHMGCMPYGLCKSREVRQASTQVSIPHMGCMPYGQQLVRVDTRIK